MVFDTWRKHTLIQLLTRKLNRLTNSIAETQYTFDYDTVNMYLPFLY